MSFKYVIRWLKYGTFKRATKKVFMVFERNLFIESNNNIIQIGNLSVFLFKLEKQMLKLGNKNCFELRVSYLKASFIMLCFQKWNLVAEL